MKYRISTIGKIKSNFWRGVRFTMDLIDSDDSENENCLNNNRL